MQNEHTPIVVIDDPYIIEQDYDTQKTKQDKIKNLIDYLVSIGVFIPEVNTKKIDQDVLDLL
jgi:hypothetical protein